MNIRSFDLDLDFGFPSGGLDGGFFGGSFLYLFFYKRTRKERNISAPRKYSGCRTLIPGGIRVKNEPLATPNYTPG